MQLKSLLRANALTLILILALILLFSFHPVEGGRGRFSRHDKISCKGCHLLTSGLRVQSGPLFDLGRRCKVCHTGVSGVKSEFQLGFHQKRDESCLKCHSFHNKAIIYAGDNVFRFNYRNSSIKSVCFTCHNGPSNYKKLSSSHTKAAAFFHVSSASDNFRALSGACVKCHSKYIKNSKHDESTACIKCHTLSDSNPKSLSVSMAEDY